MKIVLVAVSLLVSLPALAQVSCRQDALGNYICTPSARAQVPARPNSGIGATVGTTGGADSTSNPFGGGAVSGSSSVPAAGSVSQREVITSPLTDARKVLHPQGFSSASVEFNTAQKPGGAFALCSNTSYRIPNGNTISISLAPGDFNSVAPECVMENFAENGMINFVTRDRYVPDHPNMRGVCVLEPNRTYYFNVRFTNRAGTVNLCPGGGCGVFVDMM